jgi:hypothetical protein
LLLLFLLLMVRLWFLVYDLVRHWDFLSHLVVFLFPFRFLLHRYWLVRINFHQISRLLFRIWRDLLRHWLVMILLHRFSRLHFLFPNYLLCHW